MSKKRTVAQIRLYYERLEKILAEAEADKDVKALHAALAVLGSFARTDLPRLLDAARLRGEALRKANGILLVHRMTVADKALAETAWLADTEERT